MYQAQQGNLTIVASGDTMITRPLSMFREDNFIQLTQILRNADVTFTNLEMLMHNYEHSPGMAGGTFTASDPKNLQQLQWMGINLVSCANNHAYDYGEGGILTNLKHLKKSQLTHAGTGNNLSEARAPAYLETPNGRIALISASSTFPEPARALDQRPDTKGRPGINPLRFNTTHTIDHNAFQALQRIKLKLGLQAQHNAQLQFRPPGTIPKDTHNQILFMDKHFTLGEQFQTNTQLNTRDLQGNLKWINDARRMADWVIVSVHCHESGTHRDHPPQFLIDFAHAAIDEGADIFIGHGPHITRGIQIYKNKPILYSLGNFIFQNDTVQWQPSHNYDTLKLGHTSTPADFYDTRSQHDTRGFPSDPTYWQSIIAQCQFQSHKLTNITLHPIDLGFGKPRSQRGRPLIAHPPIAQRILQRIKHLSQPFGTHIHINQNTATIRL